jgi:hypothetical protein
VDQELNLQIQPGGADLALDPGGEGVALSTFLGPLELAAGDSASAEARKRFEYKANLIKAGYVRMADGQPSNFYLPADALQAGASLFTGAAVFVDHAQMGIWSRYHPSMKSLAGVIVAPEWDAGALAVAGTVRLNARQDMVWLRDILDELLEDQAKGEITPDVGLSAVIYIESEWREQGGSRIRYMTRVKKAESVDIVFSPGAEGRFKARLSSFYSFPSGNISVVNPGESQVVNIYLSQGGSTQMDEETRQDAGATTPAAAPVPATLATQVQQTPPDQLAVVQQRLDQFGQQLQQVIGLLGQREAVVEGMGQPPRQPITGRTDLERFGPAVEWLFGVPGAQLPEPSMRRADAIYWALTGDYEFRGLFDRERVQLASANVTTLAGLAVNAMNKVIIHQFSNLAMWRWYERVVWVAPNDGSLHDMQWITFGGIGNLPTVADGAAYTELTVDDAKEADPWVTKGGYVGISRKMIKNSDIARIQAVPVALATACVRTRSAAVSDIFTSNSGVGPTLDQDSTALFHTNHSNLGTTAFAQAEWRVVRTAIFKHTDVNSAKRLGYFPKYALVPADLYDSALAVFGYGDGYPTSYTPEAQDRGMGDPRPVPLAVPDWTDTNNWAAMVDPQVFPVIQMSYSQAPGGGVHPPCELFMAMDENAGLLFSNDTLPIKVRDEFVVGVNGPRGIYKENVA